MDTLLAECYQGVLFNKKAWKEVGHFFPSLNTLPFSMPLVNELRVPHFRQTFELRKFISKAVKSVMHEVC
jgi:hypothetical protein